jgi:hypothetical protein
MKPSTRALLVAPAILAAALMTLTACTPAIALEPAEDAANPACAAVSVRLPDELAGLRVRATNAQATAAWGEPANVILRCGVPPPAPTSTLQCVTVPEPNGVDWLRDPTDAPNWVFTTYGRVPALEVIINADEVSGFDVLNGLAAAVSQLPVEGRCLSLDEVLENE